MKAFAVIGLFALSLAACAVAPRPRVPPPETDAGTAARVQRLLAERSATALSNLRIGAGDHVKITATNASEVSGEFPVAKDGSVLLPLLGPVSIGGCTPAEAADRIRKELVPQYLQSTEVLVSVVGYQGQRVAVIGAVGKPGFYELTSNNETILGILTRAGGIGGQAGPEIFFTPAAGGSAPTQHLLLPASSSDLAPFSSPSRSSIKIDLAELYQGRSVPALGIPVRDGDVISVQQGGPIFVDGWVEKPSVYSMQPGMTLTQAITKAGGMHFAASSGAVTLSREDRDGHVRDQRVNYSAMAAGTEKDLYLQPGDKVYVAANPAKVVPWGIYKAVSSVIRVAITGGILLF